MIIVYVFVHVKPRCQSLTVSGIRRHPLNAKINFIISKRESHMGFFSDFQDKFTGFFLLFQLTVLIIKININIRELL